MAYRSGQKVVCVNTQVGGAWYYGAGQKLENNKVYTIHHIDTVSGEAFLHLVEQQHSGWHHSRFRPLVEIETDISVFTALLKTQTQKVPDAV
jgi:hypothetical protein